MYICVLRVLGAQGSQREGIESPETRVIDVCESLCGCWESNLGPLQEQGPLTAEPCLIFLRSGVLLKK